MDERSAATRFLELTQHLAAGFAPDGTIHTANDAFATLVGTDPVGYKVRAFTHQLGDALVMRVPAGLPAQDCHVGVRCPLPVGVEVVRTGVQEDEA